MSKKGKNVTIKGVLYEDGTVETKNDDIYKSKGGKSSIESTVTETATTEVVSQATQSGIQAVVTQVQTQVANLGASGLIAVGSAWGLSSRTYARPYNTSGRESYTYDTRASGNRYNTRYYT